MKRVREFVEFVNYEFKRFVQKEEMRSKSRESVDQHGSDGLRAKFALIESRSILNWPWRRRPISIADIEIVVDSAPDGWDERVNEDVLDEKKR